MTFSHALITSYDKDLEAQFLNVLSLEAKKYQDGPTVVINKFFSGCFVRSLIRLIVLQFLTQMNLFSDQTAKLLELTYYEVVS